MKTCQITHLNVPIIDVIKEMGGERRMNAYFGAYPPTLNEPLAFKKL